MSYMHIQNLYKDQSVLVFKKVFALEKIHGTSAHLILTRPEAFPADFEKAFYFFSGGAKHETFVKLFNQSSLMERFLATGIQKLIVYGEAYGGKEQGMSATYGKEMKFVVFDVKVGDHWLAVPQAVALAASLGLEFVHYEEGTTDLEWLNAQRDAPSVQAKRNGIVEDKPREGIVIRPPFEVTKNNGDRVMAKHKRDDFSERATPQKVVDPEKLKVLAEAQAIADEWVTPMRLTHVLQKLPPDINVEGTREVIAAMTEDVIREAKGEIVDSQDARRAIGKKTAELFKARLREVLK